MRILFILLVASFGGNIAIAQPFFNIGVRGGGNSSKMDFEPNLPGVEMSSVSGLQFGGIVQYIHQRNLGIQLDALYMSQGWRELETDGTERSFVINYLKVPFTTFAYAGNQRIRIFINAGIFGAYRMDGESSVTENGSKRKTGFPYNKERDNLVVYGLTGGGGISYDIGIGIVGADIRADFDFGNTFKPDIPNRDFSRFQTLSLSAFYMFKVVNKTPAPKP